MRHTRSILVRIFKFNQENQDVSQLRQRGDIVFGSHSLNWKS